jgi:hypothetical protein
MELEFLMTNGKMVIKKLSYQKRHKGFLVHGALVAFL